MKTISRYLLTLALLIMAVTGAWAAEETLLTTITGAGSNSNPATSANVSYSTEGVATLTFSEPTLDGNVAYQATPAWGWWGYDMSLTVTPAEGYTITKCIFYDDQNRTATDSEAPFVVETTKEDKTPKVNGTILADNSKGITKIEVYGYQSEPAPTEWPLTPDADKKVWTLAEMPANDVELEVEYYDPILTLAANNSEWGGFEVTYAGEIDDSKLTLINATDGFYGDIPENLFDGKTNTKWCCNTSDGCYIEFYTENAIEVVGYILTTANDNENYAGRNPKNWVLKGKLNENGEWETIATVSNDTKMKDVNFTPYQFDADKPGSYKYFRLEVENTKNGNTLQLSEFTLLKKSSLPDITFNEGKYSIIPGAEVTIKAIPAEGYHFDAWSNNEEGYEVGKLRLIIDEDKEITAIFAENEYNITFSEGTNPDPENPEWTATPNPAKSKQTVTVTYTGAKKVIGMKVAKAAAAGPVTYTELKGGEVLHVGDIITPTEELQINGDMYLNPSFNPYTVIRANITGDPSSGLAVTPADDGAYYVLMYKCYGENEYLLAYKPLPVTNTSDGILVRYDGVSGNYKQYTFTVHEP